MMNVDESTKVGNGMLFLWTVSDVEGLNKVVGPIVSNLGVPHKVIPIETEVPTVTSADIIVAFGIKALQILQKQGLVPKNRTISSLREKPIKIMKAILFLTYAPSIVKRDYGRLLDIQWDIALAARYHDLGAIEPIIGNYQWVTSFNEVIEQVGKVYEKTWKPVEVACDLETLGLDEYNPDGWIISIFFAVEEGTAYGMRFSANETLAPSKVPGEIGLWEQINWLLTTKEVSLRGANFKFDSRWLNKKWGIDCTNQKFDTVLVGSLLDENRSNSLKLHAKTYTSMGGYEHGLDNCDMARMDLVPDDKLLKYGGADTDATLRVAKKQKRELLRDRALANLYVKLVQPAAKVFETVERNGIFIDVPYYRYLQEELEKEAFRLQREMLKMIPRKIQIKYADNLKITRPALLREFLFSANGLNIKPLILTPKGNQPSTALEHLLLFHDNPDAEAFIDLYKEYGVTAKTLSTFVVGFLKHLRSDGRFHPTFMLHRGEYGNDDAGTVTGRTSAKDPAVQTIPKKTKWTKKLRRAFIAPEGYAIMSPDYSQGELKIAACLAKEATMLQAYLNGADLHSITAAKLNGYSKDEFEALSEEDRYILRAGGKAGNFGLIYGMSAPGYRAYAWNAYGVSLSEKEARQQRDDFFAMYSALPMWHRNYKAIAHKYGFVRSPLGRIRHLPLIQSSYNDIRSQAERQAVNSPVQSTLSDMMQLAMVLIKRELPEHDIRIFMMTHDSIHTYVPEDKVVQIGKDVVDVMSHLPLKKMFGWDPQLQFTADMEYSRSIDGVHSLASVKKA